MDPSPIKNRLLPRLRFVWASKSAPKVRWVGGLAGFQTRGGGTHGLVIYLAWRGAFLWLAALALAAFLIGTATLAYIFSRNPYNRIGYLDLVLPTRWAELKGKRGLTLIDGGLHQMQTRKYAAGIMMLARGLQLEPRNIPARMVLGEVYARNGYLYKALQVFRDGIPYAGGRRRYVDVCFRLASYLEDYPQILAMTGEAMATLPPDDHVMRRRLRDQRAEALVKLQRYDEVVALWTEEHQNPSMALNAAWARALSGQGQGDKAMSAVEQNPSAYGVFTEPWQLLMDLALQNKRPAVGRRAADALVAVDPTDYGYHVQRLVYLTQTGTAAEVRDAVGNFFLRFGLNESARVTLLKSLEPVATQDVLQAVWAQTQAIGQISVPERIAYVQDLIMAGDLPAAAREFEHARQAILGSQTPYEGWVDGTRTLLDVLATGSASGLSQLQAFCNAHPLGPAAYRMLVISLANAGRLEAARDISALVRNRYPAIQGLPSIEAPDRPTAAAVVLAQNRSGDEAARIANPEARTELAAMRADIDAGRWSTALDHIAKVERSPLAKELGDFLLYDRIAIHGHLSNQTELSWYMRRLLEQPRFDPARLRAVAMELHQSGQPDSALTLLREILRKHPEAKWASDLRQTWQDELKAAPLEGITDPGKAD